MSPIDHDCTPQERNVLLDRIAALEAHAADCKRLVTACENDLDAERMKRREVEAALQHEQEYSKEAAGASMRYCQRAESAEADLADCAKTCGGLEYRLEQAEAEVARLTIREDEAVKEMELARISKPHLPGSLEYNEGIDRCIAILAERGGE